MKLEEVSERMKISIGKIIGDDPAKFNQSVAVLTTRMHNLLKEMHASDLDTIDIHSRSNTLIGGKVWISPFNPSVLKVVVYNNSSSKRGNRRMFFYRINFSPKDTVPKILYYELEVSASIPPEDAIFPALSEMNPIGVSKSYGLYILNSALPYI